MTGEPDAVHVYWRRGCLFCTRLRRGLAAAGVETVEHDIWVEPDAAATVRAHTGGAETVPTVVVGDVALVNPSAGRVIGYLTEVAPHLVPDDADTPERSTFRRLLGT